MEKRYLLKEEVRVTRMRTTAPQIEIVTLRSQELTVAREAKIPDETRGSESISKTQTKTKSTEEETT